MSVEQRIIVTILVLASSASIMSTDLYTPSLPHMPEYFGTSAQAAKLTISLNLLAFGFAQLVFGPLSDRFGRRPVFLCGLVAFTLTSVACALAQTIEQLIVFRVLQGVAASVEAVVGLAIVRDLFFDTQRVKVLAIWGMSVALAPAVAPIIGGYIHVTAGWQANFWLVAGVGALITLLILARLAESTTPNPAAIKGRHVLASFSALLRSKAFLNHAVLLGASIGVIYAFVTAGPFI
nr:Bcr/CflA family efflux MFS transporter [Gammaproteobacteria bacterium]